MAEQFFDNMSDEEMIDQPIQDENSIYSLLNRMELMVQSAKTLPLSTSIVLNRENLLTLIAALQEQLPDAIKQAHYIVQEQNSIMKEAKQAANDYIRRAELKAATLIDENKITQEAQEKAQEIVNKAKMHADELHDYSVSYVEGLLSNVENNFKDVLEVIRHNKEELSKWDRG